MKRTKRWSAVLLSAVLILTLLPVSALAAEQPWAQSAVTTLNEIYGNGVFSADDTTMTKGDAYTVLSGMGCTSTKVTENSPDNLTRSDACEVLAEVFKLPVTGSAIQYLYEKNIINGVSPGNLAETGSVSKAQFAVLTYRVLNAVGGGEGSSIAALRPGTKEYFAWMYLAARSAVPFNESATQGNISGDEWNAWIEKLNESADGQKLDSNSLSYPSDPTTKLAAAVTMADAYIGAGGSSTIFSDVKTNNPFYDGVMYLFDHGIVNGNGDGTFNPNGNLPRFQLAVLLARLDDQKFTPQDSNDKFFELIQSINYAVGKGYMSGTPVNNNWIVEDPEWGLNSITTREEAIIAIMKQQEQLRNVDVSNVNTDILDRFTNSTVTSGITNADKYIAYAVSTGLVNGTPEGSLDLSGGTSRGVFGILLYRTLLGVDKTKMKDYDENVQNTLGTPTQQTFALLSETPEPREGADSKTLTLREDWRLTSDLDLNVPAGTTLTINGGGHHIYEMGGKLTNSGTGTVTFAEGTILYPAANDPDAAKITAEGNWDTGESNQLMVLRQPHYTVTFDANGGTDTMAPVPVPQSSSYTLPANGFTAPAGKQFKGWAASSSGEVITGGTYTVTQDTTFYAIWEDISAIALTITPSTASISGGGDVTFTTSKAADRVTCSNTSIAVNGSGTSWTATLPNSTATYTFTAEAGGKNATCTVSVTQSTSGGGSSSGGSSSGGSSSGGSSSNNTTTQTTTNPDGSKTTMETAEDGTVTATTTWDDGQQAVAVKSPEGEKTITVTTAAGEKVADVKLPAQPAEAKKFDDVKSGWYKDAVDKATGYGLFDGTSETKFSPDDGMTRAMLATVLYNLSGKPEYGTDTGAFSDVETEKWYGDPVDWAYKAGVTSGTSDTEFSPNKDITREQLVTMLYRYAEKIGAASKSRTAITSFPDGSKVANFAKDAMQWAVAEGFISGRANGGKNYITPQGTASRAEVAAVLTRFVEYLKK